jgi:hypothetical protein
MKYFIDTEFKEQPNTIELISIAIVSENGNSLYALNKECNIRRIWRDVWLRDNILSAIYEDKVHGDMRNYVPFSRRTMKWIFKNEGRTHKQLRSDINVFLYNSENLREFYGYYADYDWVTFCWIFGRMIDLPKGYPMYCKDLKQTYDEKNHWWITLTEQEKQKYCADNNLFSVELSLKDLSNYPTQKGEHSALADAKWNYELYKFLQNLPKSN